MHKEISAVILAGGRGQRMGELTSDQQKCMLPIDDKPVLTHVLDNLQTAFGSVHLVIATGYKADQIKTAYGNKYGNISIEYVHSAERLETRKRLLLADELVKGPFLYLAGDVISNPKQLVKVAESFWKEKEVMGVISGATDHNSALSHALLTSDNGHAIEMIYPPTPNWTTAQVREMGIAFYDKSFFYRLKQARPDQTYLSHVISEAIKQGTAFAVEKYFEKWYHVAQQQDLNTSIVFTSLQEKP